MLVAFADWPVSPRLEQFYAGVRALAVRAEAVPQRGPSPRVMPNHAFLADPPPPPQRPQPRAQKRPDRARVTAAKRRNGRGPTNGNNGNKHVKNTYNGITVRLGAYF